MQIDTPIVGPLPAADEETPSAPAPFVLLLMCAIVGLNLSALGVALYDRGMFAFFVILQGFPYLNGFIAIGASIVAFRISRRHPQFPLARNLLLSWGLPTAATFYAQYLFSLIVLKDVC